MSCMMFVRHFGIGMCVCVFAVLFYDLTSFEMETLRPLAWHFDEGCIYLSTAMCAIWLYDRKRMLNMFQGSISHLCNIVSTCHSCLRCSNALNIVFIIPTLILRSGYILNVMGGDFYVLPTFQRMYFRMESIYKDIR